MRQTLELDHNTWLKRTYITKLTAGHGILGIGVDLNQEGILLDEQVIQIQQHLDMCVLAIAAQTNLLDDLFGLFTGQASAYIDGFVQNGIWTAGSHLLNINTTLLGGDQHGTLEIESSFIAS